MDRDQGEGIVDSGGRLDASAELLGQNGTLAAGAGLLVLVVAWAVKRIVKRPERTVWLPDPALPLALRSSPGDYRALGAGEPRPQNLMATSGMQQRSGERGALGAGSRRFARRPAR